MAAIFLGIVGGEEVYRQGLLAPDAMDDPEMLGFDRAERRQMGVLFGRQGAMIEEFDVALKRPRTQAILILIGAVLVAGGCWYCGHLLDQDGTPE